MDVERIPNRNILRAQSIDPDTSSLCLPDLAQLIQKCHDVEKPDRVILVRIFVIEIRIVIRCGHGYPSDFGVARAAHRFGETYQLRLLCAAGPIIAIAAKRNDPLLGVRAIQEHAQPPFEPSPRTEWTRYIDVGSFVEEQRDEAIDVVRQRLEINVIEVLAGLHAKPKLFIVVVERVGETIKKRGDILFVDGIDLLPIDYDASRFRIVQNDQHLLDKTVLRFGRAVREIFHRFGLPCVTDEVGEQRQQRDPFARREFWKATIRIDLQIARSICHRHPLRADVGDLAGVLFERAKAIRIAVRVESEPHFVVLRFLPRMHWRSGRRTRRFLRRQPRRGKFFPERQIHGRLPSGIYFLQRLELSLQLAQGKRKIELRSDKQGLNEKNRA